MSQTGQLAMALGTEAATERDEWWSEAVRLWMTRLAPGEELTSDILHERFGDPRGSGNAVGGVINRQAAVGLIRFTGRSVRSARPQARGRWIRVYERTNR